VYDRTVNFDYSSVSNTKHGVSINDSLFLNNSAFAQVCFMTQAGQGGALGILGASSPPINIHNVDFHGNRAQAGQTSVALSSGGAFVMSQRSNVTAENCRFRKNVAFFGAGNDISSVAGQWGFMPRSVSCES
jgi:hypothetical protein